jgi:predicted Rossmann fold flavoprotein
MYALQVNKPNSKTRIAIVGGGAAGYFAAITCAEANRECAVTLFDAAKETLAKVRISGGGRCNVTANCFDPAELIASYPRGSRELRGPFSRFQARDTVEWFESRGVPLKSEEDGRMFPTSDSSSTIIDCLQKALIDAGVTLLTGAGVHSVQQSSDGTFAIEASEQSPQTFDKVLMCTGNAPVGYKVAEALGHTIIPCIPSLFTFKVRDARLRELQGVSFESAHLSLETGGKRHLEETGPVLITHWGLSGPAILKLSAWGARALHDAKYNTKIRINWVPDSNLEFMTQRIRKRKSFAGKQLVETDKVIGLPQRFWERIANWSGIPTGTIWANVSREAMLKLATELTGGEYDIVGKGIFKAEFVTCGGVKLSEVDFRTMESKKCPGLYFAGELLDIDGITGGFNFQSAWTTGWIAGHSMADTQ